MTNDKPPFASRLRELSAAASKGPWNTCSACHKPDGKPCGLIWSHGDDVLVAAAHGEDMADTHGDPYPSDTTRAANVAFAVALLNRAERIADVVEKAEAVRAALKAPWHSVPDMERVRHEAHNALFAALDALEGDAP